MTLTFAEIAALAGTIEGMRRQNMPISPHLLSAERKLLTELSELGIIVIDGKAQGVTKQ